MPHFLEYTPETLNQYRVSVAGWLEEALQALDSFSDEETGSYFRDSKHDSKNSDLRKTLTTPARAYMARVSASRHFPAKKSGKKEIWIHGYRKYANNLPVSFAEEKLTNFGTSKDLNNFELAKLSDLLAVEKFIGRFHGTTESVSTLSKMEKEIKGALQVAIEDDGGNLEGEIYIDDKEPDTRHFFVTLHLLRAAHIYGIELDRGTLAKHVAAAKQYCIKQCYYSSRSVQHRADAGRLAFAGVIYCQFENDDIDPDLILAIVGALAAFQQQSGNWPAIQPIFRRRDENNPWYIATHDLALCLSWLYFQPRVPDAARIIILQMMENYFLRWVIPTFRQTEGENTPNHTFIGWSDDRATGGDMVVGWASAVVCHFLANYLDVLDDVINRRVIESLSLNSYARNFLVEEGQPASNPRFSISKGGPTSVWIDLPPRAWPSEPVDVSLVQRQITWRWTDPTKGNKIADAISREVLQPVYARCDFFVGTKSVGILDGPPGTRKTSLVAALADILQWPYITVPASVFFDQGFDMMEARASEVFRKLNFLTYCVVFFDEFEEFFKDRGENDQANVKGGQNAGNRTIAAFTTSAMLPRLQDLHDRNKCIVFLATNHLEKIDPAVVRPGRFDYSIFVGHPTVDRFTTDDSYFDNLGERTLKRLNVGFDPKAMKISDASESRLALICQAVKGALGSAKVKKELKKFNESPAVMEWTKKPVKNQKNAAAHKPARPKTHKNHYVLFRFVEVALEAASSKIDEGASEAASSETDSGNGAIAAAQALATAQTAAARAAAEDRLVTEIAYYIGRDRGPATLDGLVEVS
jgi:hypothetical protein